MCTWLTAPDLTSSHSFGKLKNCYLFTCDTAINGEWLISRDAIERFPGPNCQVRTGATEASSWRGSAGESAVYWRGERERNLITVQKKRETIYSPSGPSISPRRALKLKWGGARERSHHYARRCCVVVLRVPLFIWRYKFFFFSAIISPRLSFSPSRQPWGTKLTEETSERVTDTHRLAHHQQPLHQLKPELREPQIGQEPQRERKSQRKTGDQSASSSSQFTHWVSILS